MDWIVAFGGADCEAIRSGVLAQPVNALSTIAYVLAGIAVVVAALRTSGRRRRPLMAYGAALAAVGIGSFAYHGPQPTWAGWAHDGSIAVAIGLGAGLLSATPAVWRWQSTSARVLWLTAAAALVAYVAGRTGALTCRPDSALQPHAAWHLLSATAAALLAWPAPGVRLRRRGRAPGRLAS